MNLQATTTVPRVNVVEVDGAFAVYVLEGFYYNDPDWYEPVFKYLGTFDTTEAAQQAAQSEGSQA